MRNFDVDEQLHKLGLEKFLGVPGNFKVLDVGCGRKMQLARHMQEYGIDAEGLDSCPKKQYPGLIKQRVTASYPEKGCIPRETDHYDLVVAHQNPFFFEAATSFRNTSYLRNFVLGGKGFEKHIGESDSGTRLILSEMLRVTNPRGVTLVYPGLDLLQEHFYDLIPEGRFIYHLPIEGVSEDYKQVYYAQYGRYIVEDVSFLATHRTAIYNPAEIDPKLKSALEID